MTRTRFFVRSLALTVVLVASAVAASCGGSSSDKNSSPPATGGSAGMPAKPEPVACGDLSCDPLTLPFAPYYASPCCAKGDVCGIDATPLEAYGAMFTDACQPLHQASAPDPTCPMSPPIMVTLGSSSTPVSITFAGCCHTDTNTCGYNLDKLIDIVPLGFGCVDSMPFLDGGAPQACAITGGAGATN